MENSLKMDNHHGGIDGISSIVIGCILAIGNQAFGWMNTLLQVHTIHWTAQAIIVAILGSTAGFFTNKLWRFIWKKGEDFFKNKKQKNEN